MARFSPYGGLLGGVLAAACSVTFVNMTEADVVIMGRLASDQPAYTVPLGGSVNVEATLEQTNVEVDAGDALDFVRVCMEAGSKALAGGPGKTFGLIPCIETDASVNIGELSFGGAEHMFGTYEMDLSVLECIAFIDGQVATPCRSAATQVDLAGFEVAPVPHTDPRDVEDLLYVSELGV